MSKAKAKTTTKAPDAALMRLGETLHQQIETSYACWLTSSRLAEPRERKLDRVRKAGGSDQLERSQAAYKAWERTARGKRHNAAFKAFCDASAAPHKTAKTILRKQPQTVAGAAVLSIAALWDGEWGGFSFSADDAAGRIVLALSRAAGVRLPKSVRQAVRQ